MTNRLLTTAAAVLAVLAVSGCGAVPEAGVAAEVGDDTVEVDDFEALLRDVSSLEGSGVVADPATDTIDGDIARNVLGIVVAASATRSYLEANGESITDADRQPILDQIAADDPSRDHPDVLAVIVDAQASAHRDRPGGAGVSGGPAGRLRGVAGRARRAVRAPRPRRQRGRGPGRARRARRRRVDGGPRRRALDRSECGHERRGDRAHTRPGCMTVAAAGEAGLVGPFVDAASTAVDGTPVGPVQTDFGWHVIEARPYEEIADSLEVAASEQAFEQYMRDLDVRIDPRYGRWDADQGAVVEL